MANLLDLPAEILLEIALAHPATFVGLARSCQTLRELLNEPSIRDKATRLFTRCIVLTDGLCDVLPNGMRHGMEIISGVVEDRVESRTFTPYHMGRRHGVQRQYVMMPMADLVLRAETTFVDDISHGIVKTYYADGALCSVSNWEHGHINGVQIIYSESGYVATVSGWAMGKLHGTRAYYNERGVAWEVSEWADGIRHGTQRDYYDNGPLMCVTNWVAGKKHGISAHYNMDGKLNCFAEWRDGRRRGTFVRYCHTGACESVSEWVDDLPHGVRIDYYTDSGAVERIANWVHGNRDGLETWYDPDGTMTECVKWSMGKRVSEEEAPDAKRRG